ncbi:hypothetical protein FRB98_007157 [Tulasnella sp. 332]|nr:hypothetical protein FRB98_007157 [Tulasnella sp. 332]
MSETKFMIDAILFDMDGATAVERAWAYWGGIYPHLDIEHILRTSHGVRTIDNLRKWNPEIPETDLPARVHDFEMAIVTESKKAEERGETGIILLPGVTELLKSLGDKNWAICTSATHAYADGALEAVHIRQPPVFVTADDVARGKPFPDPYLLGAEKCGVDPTKCLVVEDAPSGVASGKAARCHVVAVCTSHTEERMLQTEPDILIKDLACTLEIANFEYAADILLHSQDEIFKKTKLPLPEIEAIVQLISHEILDPPRRITRTESLGFECFTSGDQRLDGLLGGGIRTGAVWEIAGEGAAGKTQLAFQLALTVQTPMHSGGLSGSVCFISAGSTLATQRLEQLIVEHPALSPNNCSLADIHTCSVDIPKALTYYLREALPELIGLLAITPGAKPIKLIVIDSIASLFRSAEKTSIMNLVERSKALAEISRLLHGLVVNYGLAAVVVNDVTAVFEKEVPIVDQSSNAAHEELFYTEQSRWFNRPDDTFRDDKRDAALGLVWANQVNVRLFMSRTGRAATIRTQSSTLSVGDNSERSRKRRRIDLGSNAVDTTPPGTSTVLRRLDVIFSSFSPAQSIDFILTPSGLRTIPATLTTSKPASLFGYEMGLDGGIQLDPPSSGSLNTLAQHSVEADLLADLEYDALEYSDEDIMSGGLEGAVEQQTEG